MVWPDVLRNNFVAAILVATTFFAWQYVIIHRQNRRQRHHELQQLTDGYQIGYHQCLEDHKSASAGGPPVLLPIWTQEQTFERLAAEYFRKGSVPESRDWLILDRRPKLPEGGEA